MNFPFVLAEGQDSQKWFGEELRRSIDRLLALKNVHVHCAQFCGLCPFSLPARSYHCAQFMPRCNTIQEAMLAPLLPAFFFLQYVPYAFGD
jgi:hypothetical protein